MGKPVSWFITWCQDNSTEARFTRTIAQGLISLAISLLTYAATKEPVMAMVIQPAAMAILSPIQKAIGNRGEVDERSADDQ